MTEWVVPDGWVPTCWGEYPFTDTDYMCSKCPVKKECVEEYNRLQNKGDDDE
jgi:hypothetical protein